MFRRLADRRQSTWSRPSTLVDLGGMPAWQVMELDPIPTFHTERLVLTPLRVADAVDMFEVYSDEEMYTFTGGSPPSETHLRDRYEKLAEGWNHDRSEQWCNWIVRRDGRRDPVGAIQATIAHSHAQASVAWEIGVRYRGQGYASEAASAVVNWLVATGVVHITASIHPDHAASATVASRLGLTPTGEVDDGEIVWHRGRGDDARPGVAECE